MKKEIIAQIIGVNNGVGLSKDFDLISSLMKEMKEMNIKIVPKTPLKQMKNEMSYVEYKIIKSIIKSIILLSKYLPRKKNTQIINIFLENIEPYYINNKDINCFIPNLEWLNGSDIKLLSKIDCVLCKTHFTQNVICSFPTDTYYTSFTSEDRLNIKESDKFETFFHLAGSSAQKGTDVLVDLWLQHPEWPTLTVVQNPKMYKRKNMIDAENINYILEYLDDSSLRKLQNENFFHLCPSEAEGFGHYIVEALSCGAIALTTDAPPMNEIINEERGVLVKYKSKKPQKLGMNYYVDEDDLENQINKILEMTVQEKRSISEKARQWFVQNDEEFRREFRDCIHLLTQKKCN